MATTSQQPNPIPSEQVIIDVDSVVYGYPVNPQPPLPSAAALDSKKASQAKRDCYMVVAFILIFIVISSVTFALDMTRKKLPRFQLDSVSFNRAANTTTAVWDIGFSIDKNVGDLGLWVRFMARDYKVDSVGTAGNGTVAVSVLLPRDFDFSGGLRIEQVMFRCKNYKDYLLEAACKDVAVDVGFSSNDKSTPARGVMEGGPRLCPVVNHKHI